MNVDAAGWCGTHSFLSEPQWRAAKTTDGDSGPMQAVPTLTLLFLFSLHCTPVCDDRAVDNHWFGALAITEACPFLPVGVTGGI